MAYETPTIDQLLAKRNASKEAMESKVDGNIERIVNGARRSYDNVLNDIRTLEALKDTSFQIREYGIEQWNNDFVRVSELSDGVNNERWKKIRSTRFARFQMAFCDPADWIVHRLERTDLETCSLKGCLVRGDWIQDEFASSMGFISPEEREEFDGDPVGRVAHKQNLTEHLKAVHESTSPIGGSRRMMRVNPRSERTQSEYPNIPAHADWTHGSIVGLRENVNGGGDRKMLQMYFEDSGSMLRKTLHQEHAHVTENDFLEQCQTELEGLIIDLDTRYRKGTPEEEKQELWEKSQATIARYNERLLRCFGRLKEEASKFLLDASDLEDAQHKPNISRAMAKITAARTRLSKRGPQTKAIERYNMEDRQIMYMQTRREEHTLRRFRRIVTAETQRMEDERTKGTPGAEDRARRAIESAAKQLPSVVLRPTRGAAETLAKQAWGLDDGSPEAFDEQLLVMHVTGKLQGLRTSLDWMRLDCAQTKRLDVRHAFAFVTNVKKAYMDEQILPGKRIAWLDEILAPYTLELERIHTRLKHYNAHPPSQDEEETVREKFLEYLDTIDVDGAISTIAERIAEPKYERETFTLTSSK